MTRSLAHISLLTSLAVATPAQVSWQQVPPTAQDPSARNLVAMAHDIDNGVTIAFGGASSVPSNPTPLGETWEWNGASWRQLTPASSPTPRWGARMVYDTSQRQIVLFGGYDGATSLDDTWIWNGNDWQQALPATSPPDRQSHGLAFDVVLGRAVLFGGRIDTSTQYRNDLWEWNGATQTWTQLNSATSPPSRRYGMAMAYDGARQNIIMFGGFDGSYRVGTWAWDGAAWSLLTTVHDPDTRFAGEMVFHPALNALVLFGGLESNNAYRNTLWEWNGRSWGTLAVLQSAPSRRAPGGLAYDAGRDELVMIGGFTTGNARLGDTWTCRELPRATFDLFGAGCGGTSAALGLAAHPLLGRRPVLGATFVLEVSSIPPAQPAAMIFSPFRLPTPVPIGRDCLLQIPLTFVLALTVSPAGTATWSLPIPPEPTLAGGLFYNQAIALDLTVAPPWVVSNAGAGVYGSR